MRTERIERVRCDARLVDELDGMQEPESIGCLVMRTKEHKNTNTLCPDDKNKHLPSMGVDGRRGPVGRGRFPTDIHGAVALGTCHKLIQPHTQHNNPNCEQGTPP